MMIDWERVDVGDDTIGRSFVFLSPSTKDDDKNTNPSHTLVKIVNSPLIITDYQTSISNHNTDPIKSNLQQTSERTQTNSVLSHHILDLTQSLNSDQINMDPLTNSLKPHDQVKSILDLTKSLNSNKINMDPLTSSLKPHDQVKSTLDLTNSLNPDKINMDPLTNSLKPHDLVKSSLDLTKSLNLDKINMDQVNNTLDLTKSLNSNQTKILINSHNPHTALTNSYNPPSALTNTLNSPDILTNSYNPPNTLTNTLNSPDILTNSYNPPNTLTNTLNFPDILTNSYNPPDTLTNAHNSPDILTNSQKHHIENPQSVINTEEPKNKIITDFPKDNIYSKFIKDVYKDQPITVNTPISVLEGIDDCVAEILETQASVRGLGALVSLPVDIYNFIKDAGLVVDLERLIQNASALLVEAERMAPVTDIQVMDGEYNKLEESVVHPDERNSVNDKAPDIEILPITILKGINNDGMALSLEKHAFIFTIGELAAFPTNWPGIYNMIKDSDMLPELDMYIEIAKKWIVTGKEPNLESETVHKNSPEM